MGLVPAAIMGLDVGHLLEGPAAMNERFRTAAPAENPPLAYAGVSRLMETRRGATIRVLSTWGKGLKASANGTTSSCPKASASMASAPRP